jgi:hypothetical protein
MTHLIKSPLIAVFALLSACASTYTSPVELTRFVGEQPEMLGKGTITLRAGESANQADSLEFAEYSRAIANELAALGYTLVPNEAEQVAEIWIDRMVARPQRGRSPVSVGVGGSTGSYGSGVGMGLGIDLSGPPPEQVHSLMRVTIRDRKSGKSLWEGRAEFTTTAKSEYAVAQASAEKLASALFGGFPGNSGETITVK